ncbi:MAG: hypothetical protein ACK5KQ_06810 [Anaerorhabdus sp.]
MKFRLFIICILLILLVGCSNNVKKEMSLSQYNEYKGVYDLIESQEEFLTSSNYFDVEVEIVESEKGKYLYYVFIDNPRNEMYDVEAMVVEEDSNFNDVVFPTIGIIDNEKYNLVPSNSNFDEGFVKGLVLSGETYLKDSYNFKINLTWNGLSSEDKRFSEFISITKEME